jgi:hypothetical protein
MANKAQKMIPKHSRIEGRALLAIVLSVPLYGFVLVSFFVLYWPLYCLSLYTAMFWYHFLALLAIVLSVPLYSYVLVSFLCALLAIVLSVHLYSYFLVSFLCALLAIVLSVPLYGYVYSFGIFKLFYHFVVYLLFIYKLYIPDHAYMFHNEYKTCLAKLLYMYLFSICKAYFHQTQFGNYIRYSPSVKVHSIILLWHLPSVNFRNYLTISMFVNLDVLWIPMSVTIYK